MRKIIFFTILICIPFVAIFSQVGIGTDSPHVSAQLDVSSTNKGFLPPRVALLATNNSKPVSNPAIGLLVYNTATAGGTPIHVSPGYYYWNGSAWYPIVNKGSSPGDMQYWDGAKWVNIPLGLNGQNLTICNGIPTWGPCNNVITIKSSNNAFEGIIASNDPNLWNDTFDELFLTGWTVNGIISNTRYMVKFNLLELPANAVVDSAKLYLYADSTPIAGNMIDANFGSSNSFYIQRITSQWTVANAYSWNTQPTTTSTNQVLVPQSTSSFQNEIVNVTGIVKDMQTNGNNGFLMKLQTEVTYNSRQYLSGKSNDSAKHPKLIIYYH